MQQQHSEEWRPIPWFEGFYSASDQGRIRSEPQPVRTTGRQHGRVLAPSLSRKGYQCVRLCVSGRRLSTQVHCLVAAAFIGPRPDGLQVNHKDGIKTNNLPGNLEYVTCKENVQHCWANGMHGVEHCRGVANVQAKLDEEKVERIRQLHATSSLGEIAKTFGVTKQAVWAIVRRKTWNHVA